MNQKSPRFPNFLFHYCIQEGMTLENAELVLGKARKMDYTLLSKLDGPVVHGDESYTWKKDGVELWVGVTGGKITDKYVHDPRPHSPVPKEFEEE